MTHKLKYPIGAKIKLLYNNKDKNKVGIIVGINKDGYPLILIPSTSYEDITRNGITFSWQCVWEQIELAYTKNEQLLFKFMSEAT